MIALLDIKPCVLTCKYGRLYELNKFVYLDEKFNIYFQLSTDGMNVKGYNCYNDNNINHKNISLHGHTGAILTLNYRIYRHQQKVQNVRYELEVGHAVKLHLKLKGLKRRS